VRNISPPSKMSSHSVAESRRGHWPAKLTFTVCAEVRSVKSTGVETDPNPAKKCRQTCRGVPTSAPYEQIAPPVPCRLRGGLFFTPYPQVVFFGRKMRCRHGEGELICLGPG